MAAPNCEDRPGSRFAHVVLGLALAGAAAMLYYHFGLFVPQAQAASRARGLGAGYAFGCDFYPVWLASREWLGARRDPYSREVTREIQAGLFGRPLDAKLRTDPKDLRMFAHPVFTLLLVWPAAELPFASCRVLVVALLAAMTLISILFWAKALAWRLRWNWLAVTVLLTLVSYPALEGLYAGQLGLLVAFLLAASALALRRGKLWLAGILMALTTMKPQMTLLAVFYFLAWSFQDWHRRSRFCLGLVCTMTLLVSAALLVWPHWIPAWVRAVVEYHRYARPPLVGEVLASPLGLAAAGPATLIMSVSLIAAAGAQAWRHRAAAADSPEFWLTLTLLLSVTTITLLPGQAVYDHLILLPGILLLASRWRSLGSSWISKALLATGAALILWPWFAAGCVIALRGLLSRQRFYSPGVVALPLRTAAVLPFVVVGLLALASRRARLTGQEERLSPAG